MGADHDQAIRWAEVLRQTERLLTQSAQADDAITAWAAQAVPEQRPPGPCSSSTRRSTTRPSTPSPAVLVH
jgi:hypothetical protein